MEAQDEYFESYQDLEVHRLMLADAPRNEAYRNAIIENAHLIRGKTVLDVGAGSGILSVFCAKAGASKVFAVEASSISRIAEEVVKENDLENIISVINSRVEDVELPVKVDAIVSEWMGFYLLHEGMLDSVLIARDKFLKEGGIMFPSTATLYAAPCSVPTVFDFWHSVSGVSMRSVGRRYRSSRSSRPEVLSVAPADLLHPGEVVAWLDLSTTTPEDVSEVVSRNVLTCKRSGRYQGLCLWFECGFPGDAVSLSTSPWAPLTHWKQSAVVLPQEVAVEEGEPLAFELKLKKQAEDSRKYVIEFTMLDPDTEDHPQPCNCYMTKCILLKAMLAKYETEGNCDGDVDDPDPKLEPKE